LVKSLVRAFVDVDDLRQYIARRQIEAGQDDKIRQITPPRWAGQIDDDGESLIGIRGGSAER
jgi:hypothetical protein